jgi:transposase
LCDIVVLDETYVTTKFTRLRGRSRRGERLVARVPYGQWELLTVLAAITVHGPLAAVSVRAAADSDVFRAFVDHALVPALRPGQVVVMDNLAVHKVRGVAESVVRAGCRVVYLPPYSPDLSPIECVFAKFKQHLRSAQARTVPALHEAVGHAPAAITAADCRGCFNHCGYSLQRS